MRIASIALKDFRAYHDAAMTFDEPLSIIRGANHAGKSTIAQALQLALTRRTDGTNAAGAGADDKIRQGAKKAEVTVMVETRIGPAGVRMIQKPGSRNFEIGGSAEAIAGFEEYLLSNSARWSSVLDPQFFVSQSEKEQKAILSALIAPAEYDFDPAMMNLAKKYTGAVEGDDPVAIIDFCHSKVFTARTKAKAALDAIRIPQPVPAPQYSVAKIREFLDKLRDELGAESGPDHAEIERASETGRIAAQLRQKESELRIAQNDQDFAKQRIKDAEQLMLTGPQITKHKKTAEGRAKLKECEVEIAKFRAKVLDLNQSIEDIKELAADPGECPTCKRLLTEETRDEVVAALMRQVSAVAASETEWLDIQENLGDIAGAEAALKDHETGKQAKLDATRQQTAATDKITAIGKEIVDLTNRLNDLKNQPAAAAPRDTTDLKAKIEGWEQKLLEANTYETRQEQITAAEANRRSHAAAVDELERLVSYFGKDGVKADIIKASIKGFTEQVNAVLEVWGYSCEFSVEPYQFIVTTADGYKGPLKELSGSEQLMFGVALQSAIAIQSGIRLMVIDAADTMIDEDRGALFTGLTSLLESEELEQVIVLVADNRTEVPDAPGVGFYRVGDGKVERLGQPTEATAAA